jgi:hypothetical protein
MFDFETCKVEITVSDRRTLMETQKSKKKLKVFHKDANKFNKTMILTNVHYVSGLVCSLFSLISTVSSGSIITSNDLKLTINKG